MSNHFKMRDEPASEDVLGTLSAARRRAVEQRLPVDAAMRAAVQLWEERLLPLTALAEPRDPSASLWGRIESSLQAAKAAAPTPHLAAVAPATAPAPATVSPIRAAPVCRTACIDKLVGKPQSLARFGRHRFCSRCRDGRCTDFAVGRFADWLIAAIHGGAGRPAANRTRLGG